MRQNRFHNSIVTIDTKVYKNALDVVWTVCKRKERQYVKKSIVVSVENNLQRFIKFLTLEYLSLFFWHRARALQ